MNNPILGQSVEMLGISNGDHDLPSGVRRDDVLKALDDPGAQQREVRDGDLHLG